MRSSTAGQRAVNAALGGLGGFLAGLGLAVTVAQGGRFSFDGREDAAGIACLVAAGIVLGALNLQGWPRRVLIVATLAVPLAGPAVAAQQPLEPPACLDIAEVDVNVTGSDGPEPIDVAAATHDRPLRLDLTRLEELDFTVDLDDPTQRGTITLAVGLVRPFGFLGDSGPIYHGPVEAGIGRGSVRVSGTWPLQVDAAPAPQPGAEPPPAQLARVPFGRLRIDAVVLGGGREELCRQQVWVQLGSSPFGHPAGIAALALQALGALAMAASMKRTATGPDDGPPPPPPKLSICTDDGRVLELGQSLTAGVSYELKLSPSLRVERREGDPSLSRVSGQGIEIPGDGLFVDLSASTGLLSFGIPFRALRPGKARLVADVFRQGGLLATEQVDLAVSGRRGAPAGPAARQRTLVEGASLPEDAEPRAAAIVMHEEDGEAALRSFATTGDLLVPHRRVDTAQLASAGRAARQALESSIARPGDAALLGLARAGRDLHDALFPGPDPLAGAAGQGSIVQVRFDLATPAVPWSLVFDGPQLRDADRVCASFATHLPGACPAAGDARVVCPARFWGLRYTLEAGRPGVDEPPAGIPLERVDGDVVTVAGLAAGGAGEAAAGLATDVLRRTDGGTPVGAALRHAARDRLAASGNPVGLGFLVLGRPDVVVGAVAP